MQVWAWAFPHYPRRKLSLAFESGSRRSKTVQRLLMGRWTGVTHGREPCSTSTRKSKNSNAPHPNAPSSQIWQLTGGLEMRTESLLRDTVKRSRTSNPTRGCQGNKEAPSRAGAEGF